MADSTALHNTALSEITIISVVLLLFIKWIVVVYLLSVSLSGYFTLEFLLYDEIIDRISHISQCIFIMST